MLFILLIGPDPMSSICRLWNLVYLRLLQTCLASLLRLICRGFSFRRPSFKRQKFLQNERTLAENMHKMCKFTIQPQGLPSPNRLTLDQAPPKSFEFGLIFSRFWSVSALLSQLWSTTAKIDSKSTPLEGVTQCAWPSAGGGLWLEVRSQCKYTRADLFKCS